LRWNAHSLRGNRCPGRGFSEDLTRFGTFGGQPRLGFGPFALWAITSSATAAAATTALCCLAGLNRFFEIRRDARRIIREVGLM
jgi:hypothetical protein